MIGNAAGAAYSIQNAPAATDGDLDPATGDPPSALWFAGNNLVVIMLLFTGAISFGVSTAVVLFINGFMIASIIVRAILFGKSPVLVIALTVPHGVFELAAMIFAGAVGFMISHKLVLYLIGHDERLLRKKEQQHATILSLLSVVLILVAALIEARITHRTVDILALPV
jgi:uncharacterized membrane protein SpoIIM required for sporulation